MFFLENCLLTWTVLISSTLWFAPNPPLLSHSEGAGFHGPEFWDGINGLWEGEERYADLICTEMALGSHHIYSLQHQRSSPPRLLPPSLTTTSADPTLGKVNKWPSLLKHKNWIIFLLSFQNFFFFSFLSPSAPHLFLSLLQWPHSNTFLHYKNASNYNQTGVKSSDGLLMLKQTLVYCLLELKGEIGFQRWT